MQGIRWRARLPGTWGLIGVLVLVHLVSGWIAWQAGLGTPWEAFLGERPPRMRAFVGGQVRVLVERGAWWRLATSVLLHGDALHLGVNALALGVLGRVIEPWMGPLRTLAWFAAGGLAGSLASQAVGVSASDGASGGAFALLGAAAVLGWRWRRALPGDEARLLGPVLWAFIVANVVLSFLLPFVDAAGHLGGLVVGGGLGAVGRPQGSRAPAALVVAGFVGVCAWGWLAGA